MDGQKRQNAIAYIVNFYQLVEKRCRDAFGRRYHGVDSNIFVFSYVLQKQSISFWEL